MVEIRKYIGKRNLPGIQLPVFTVSCSSTLQTTRISILTTFLFIIPEN